MTTVDRDLPAQQARARRSGVGRIAQSVLERVLPGVEGGTLVLRLPDGSQTALRLGAGVAHADRRLAPARPHRPEPQARARRVVTRPANGARTISSPSSSCFCATPAAGAERHPGWRRFARSAAAHQPPHRAARRRRNIEAHYDLGNDLFALFLDETLTYSCAIFEHDGRAARRRAATQAAPRLRAARARPGRPRARDRLRLGLVRAARRPASSARASPRLTISPRAGRAGAPPRSRRPASPTASRSSSATSASSTGTFTKIASIEMLEAIGEKQSGAVLRDLRPAARARRARLHPDDPRARRALRALPLEPGLDRAAHLPRLPHPLARGASRALRPSTPPDRGDPRSAPTTPRRCAAGGTLPREPRRVRALGYDERFVRTWDFYLASCEALFRTGLLRDAQLVLAR